MSIEKPDYSFLWRIENFSMLGLKTGERLSSPEFSVETFDNTKWFVDFYPKGINDEKYFSCYLRRAEDDSSPDPIIVYYKLSIVPGDGTYELFEESGPAEFEGNTTWGHAPFVLRREVFEAKDKFLCDDTLILRCDMWRHCLQKRTAKECVAKTAVKCQSICVVWPIHHFSLLKPDYTETFVVKDANSQKSLFELKFFFHPVGGSESPRQGVAIHFMKVKRGNVFLSFDVSILNPQKKEAYTLNGCRGFTDAEDTLTLSYKATDELLAKKDLYSAKDILMLKLKLKISEGVESSIIESCTYLSPQCCSPSSMVGNETLSDILESLYESNDLADVKIRSGGETFLAHQLVLSVRSLVFKKMLQDKKIQAAKKLAERNEFQKGNSSTASRDPFPGDEEPALAREVILEGVGETEAISDVLKRDQEKNADVGEDARIVDIGDEMVKSNGHEVPGTDLDDNDDAGNEAAPSKCIDDDVVEKDAGINNSKIEVRNEDILTEDKEADVASMGKDAKENDLAIGVTEERLVEDKEDDVVAEELGDRDADDTKNGNLEVPVSMPEENNIERDAATVEGGEEKKADDAGVANDVIMNGPEEGVAPEKENILPPENNPVFNMRAHEMAERDDMQAEEPDMITLNIPFVAPTTLRHVLHYIYTSKLELNDYDEAGLLYIAADRFELYSLKSKCLVFLKHQLNPKNICTLLRLADEFKDNELKSAALQYMNAHLEEILFSQEWRFFSAGRKRLADETCDGLEIKKSR
ncbi:speckle-type POZ protein B [Caerostris darwini]|uniref:Speckle-type POZ protein B n=1 Tax=Caerostris darwini TaxID=1538125 RepID=A0AAV4TI10_9ARAC|nr:speckle-type POZ protein B [Caerostris darwini]